jgi:hypothetical protein
MLFSGCSTNRLTAVCEWKRHHRSAALPEAIAHHPGPDTSRRAQLGDFFEEIVVNVEEKRQARGKTVDVEAVVNCCLDVLNAVGECEGQLLQRRRAGFTNVIAADRDGVPARHVLRPVLEGIDDQLGARARRKDVLLLRDVLLQDVVLKRAPDLLPRRAVLLRDREVHRERDRRRRVDRHRRGIVERDTVEQNLHVGERDTATPHVPNSPSASDRRCRSRGGLSKATESPSLPCASRYLNARWFPRRCQPGKCAWSTVDRDSQSRNAARMATPGSRAAPCTPPQAHRAACTAVRAAPRTWS